MLNEILTQAVAETAKGGGSSLVLDSGMVAIIVTQAFLIWRGWVDRQTVKQVALNLKLDNATGTPGMPNGNRPGFTTTCIRHSEEISRLITKTDRYDEDLREIKGDLKILTNQVAKIAIKLGVEIEERKRGDDEG